MGINSEQHVAFHRAVLTLRDVIESGDFNKAAWMQDEAIVSSLWLAASSVKYKLADYVKAHERYPWDKVTIATDLPRAVFCSHLQPEQRIDWRHIGIHIEQGSCVDPRESLAMLLGSGYQLKPVDQVLINARYHGEDDHIFDEVEYYGPAHPSKRVADDHLCGCGYALYWRECHACSEWDMTNRPKLDQHKGIAETYQLGDSTVHHPFAPVFTEDDGHRHDSGDILVSSDPPTHQCKYCGRMKLAADAWTYGVQA